MTSRSSRRGAVALLLSASLCAAPAASAQTDPTRRQPTPQPRQPSKAIAAPGSTRSNELALERLRARLAKNPRDVDAKLKLAVRLSWRDKTRSEARRLAREVIARAPTYWDAHLLLARTYYWDGQRKKAARVLEAVLAENRQVREAEDLLLQIYIGDKRLDEAKARLRARTAAGEGADAKSLTLRALIELEQMHHVRAYRLALEATRKKPDYALARRLRRDIVLVRALALYEFEAIPIGDRISSNHGEIAVLTVLPRAWLSATLIHEFRNRFDTNNNRLQLQLDWRITKRLSVSARGGGGFPAKVIPKATVFASVGFDFGYFDARLSYGYDRLTLPGDMHRVGAFFGVPLPWHLAFYAGYQLGSVRANRDHELVHAFSANLVGSWKWFEASLRYGLGTEATRSTTWRQIDELRSNDFGGDVFVRLHPTIPLYMQLGYDVVIRANRTVVHIARGGLRYSL